MAGQHKSVFFADSSSKDSVDIINKENTTNARNQEAERIQMQPDLDDSEWETTTDTSIHSTSDNDVSHKSDISQEMLEACDGLDEMSLSSPRKPKAIRGRRGGGQGRTVAYGRKNTQEKEKSDSGSSQTESSDSVSSSEYESSDSECLSESSDSEESYTSVTSSEGGCSECSSECSCSCHEDSTSESSTSYESTDDLTNLRRVKSRGRLGRKGARKVMEQCAQS